MNDVTPTLVQDGEVWTTLVFREKKVHQYKVSSFGRLINVKTGKELGGKVKHIRRNYNGNAWNITVPKNLYEDYEYRSVKSTSKVCCLEVAKSRAVYLSFYPIDEYPPARLRDDWLDMPESAKQWVRETVVIDHIDDDPTNNRLDNLRAVTIRENANYIKLKQIKENCNLLLPPQRICYDNKNTD